MDEIIQSGFPMNTTKKILLKLNIKELLVLEGSKDEIKSMQKFDSKSAIRKNSDYLSLTSKYNIKTFKLASFVLINNKLSKMSISPIKENNLLCIFSMFDLFSKYKETAKNIRLCSGFSLKIHLANCSNDPFFCRSLADRKAIIRWILKK